MITVVSGLPRCGTSMMMQMLEAGGMPALTDGVRGADEDNLRGYYELEKVKQMKQDSSWLGEAEGKVFKMVSMLLYDLPPQREYKVVFMTREMDEMLNSQWQMLHRLGKDTADRSDDAMRGHFEAHLANLHKWLAQQENIDVLPCSYNEVLREPRVHIDRLADFLDAGLDRERMQQAVDPSMYRQRVGNTP